MKRCKIVFRVIDSDTGKTILHDQQIVLEFNGAEPEAMRPQVVQGAVWALGKLLTGFFAGWFGYGDVRAEPISATETAS